MELKSALLTVLFVALVASEPLKNKTAKLRRGSSLIPVTQLDYKLAPANTEPVKFAASPKPIPIARASNCDEPGYNAPQSTFLPHPPPPPPPPKLAFIPLPQTTTAPQSSPFKIEVSEPAQYIRHPPTKAGCFPLAPLPPSSFPQPQYFEASAPFPSPPRVLSPLPVPQYTSGVAYPSSHSPPSPPSPSPSPSVSPQYFEGSAQPPPPPPLVPSLLPLPEYTPVVAYPSPPSRPPSPSPAVFSQYFEAPTPPPLPPPPPPPVPSSLPHPQYPPSAAAYQSSHPPPPSPNPATVNEYYKSPAPPPPPPSVPSLLPFPQYPPAVAAYPSPSPHFQPPQSQAPVASFPTPSSSSTLAVDCEDDEQKNEILIPAAPNFYATPVEGTVVPENDAVIVEAYPSPPPPPPIPSPQSISVFQSPSKPVYSAFPTQSFPPPLPPQPLPAQESDCVDYDPSASPLYMPYSQADAVPYLSSYNEYQRLY